MLTNFESLENIHKGERCFIVGSAPSILDEDLSLLKDEKVITLNHSFKLIDYGLKKYHYYVCADKRSYGDIYKNIKKEIPEDVIKFYPNFFLSLNSYRQEPLEKFVPRPLNRDNSLLANKFPLSFTDGWIAERSVIFDASLIAFFMGFDEVFWLGVDLHYPKDKDTHFFGKRVRAQQNRDPFNLYKDDIITLLENITNYFEHNNRKIINLSKNFAFKDYMEVSTLEKIFK